MKIEKIRIRMYRHGLGDCFLLTLSDREDKKFHMLIDCGIITGTKDPKVIMTEVAKDILKETQGKIDIVVVTHEHWDHVSGFKQARDTFRDIEFEEVWMAWTEDPNDDFANGLRKAREERKLGIASALQKLKQGLVNNKFLDRKQKSSQRNYLTAVEEITSFNGGLGLKGMSATKEALEYVKTKIKTDPFYCHPDRDSFGVRNIEGLRFYILGPPKSEKLIKMDLSKKEVYQKSFNSEFGNSFLNAIPLRDNQQIFDNYLPFDANMGIRSDDPELASIYPVYFRPNNEWRKIDLDWMDFCGQLALALDNDTNNTSLAFAIEIVNTQKFLLFTGDAQVGNWLSWHDLSWKRKNGSGRIEKIDINTIFKNTIFYKVSHHGSHNGTLREKGLELMTDSDLVAMIPVDRPVAEKKGWDMPLESLFKRLNEKASGKVILADEKLDENSKTPSSISKSDWSRFIEHLPKVANDLFIDYVIDC